MSSDNDLDKKIAYYTHLLEIDPNNAELYFQRGINYFMIGNAQKAILDNSKTIEIDPHHIGAYACRGMLFWTRRDYDRTIEDLSKLITPNYSDRATLMCLAFAYFKKFVTGKVHGNQKIICLRYMKVTLVNELKKLSK